MHDPAALFAQHDAGFLEHGEMFHEGRQRHGERPGDFTHRHFVGRRQPRDDRAAGRIGERAEGEIEAVGRIVIHMV